MTGAALALALVLTPILASGAAWAEEPALPPNLAEEISRERNGEAVEGRALSNSAMARASGAYLSEDYATALLYAEQAAVAGEARGAALAGHIRLHGLHGRTDEGGAVRWLRRAAELNEPDSLVILARMAEQGQAGLEPVEAQSLYRRAADTGDSRGALEYGLFLQNRNDPNLAAEALEWLGLAARAGDDLAYAPYAAALDDWVHGPRDPSQALEWYERAAEAGDAAAALQAGLMHVSGEASAADPARGAQLIAMAAELGLPAAMGQRALLMFQGEAGLTPDPTGAAGWARRGAEGGDPESQFLYAYALATGDGTARDLERAYVWTLRAGYPHEDTLADDPDRLGLEAALRQALPEDARQRLETEAQTGAPGRYGLNPTP